MGREVDLEYSGSGSGSTIILPYVLKACLADPDRRKQRWCNTVRLCGRLQRCPGSVGSSDCGLCLPRPPSSAPKRKMGALGRRAEDDEDVNPSGSSG